MATPRRRKRKPTRKQLAALARGRATQRRKAVKRRAPKRRTAKRRAPKRRAVKAHRRVRATCKVCGHVHSRSQHRSHGTGSFRRTHR